jgi:predicted RNase H-like HicB family nuclease
MKRYLVVVEASGDNYSAYSPDVPGCIAAGDTVEKVLDLI